MNDKETTIAELQKLCTDFRAARHWDKIPGDSAHTLAKDVVVEAAEILDHFIWDTTTCVTDPEQKREVEFEVVDTLFALLTLGDKLDMDLTTTLKEKLQKLEKKYPVEEVQDYKDDKNLGKRIWKHKKEYKELHG